MEKFNMDHDVHEILDNCKVITKDGALLFRYKTTRELLDENRLLLQQLKDTCQMGNELYTFVIIPLINRFSKIVSVAPASKFLHDSCCGGLFRHSLLVAVKVCEIHKVFGQNSVNSEADYVLLVFLSLLHDIGKMLSDYDISANGISFDYDNDKINYTLDDFLKNQKSRFVKVLYKYKRNKDHELYNALMLKFLLYGQGDLAEYLVDKKSKDAINSVLFNDASNRFFKMIKTADIFACKVSVNRYSPLFEIGNYIKFLFCTKVINLSLTGFYRVSCGYVVEKGSAAHQAVIRAFDVYYEILNECKSFSELNCKHFESCYSTFQNSLTARLLDSNDLSDVSDDSYFKYPKKSFYFELADSNFYVQGTYKRACIWRELYKNGKVKFVYGYFLSFEHETLNHVYSIVNEYKDDYVLDILSSNDIEFSDCNRSNVTSFCVKKSVEENLVIDKVTVCRDSFSKFREDLSKKNTKQRELSKKKEKSSLNRTVKALQNELEEQEKTELDNYWLL